MHRSCFVVRKIPVQEFFFQPLKVKVQPREFGVLGIGLSIGPSMRSSLRGQSKTFR